MGHVSTRVAIKACGQLFDGYTPEDYLQNINELFEDDNFSAYRNELAILNFQGFLETILELQEENQKKIDEFSSFYQNKIPEEFTTFKAEVSSEHFFQGKSVLFTGTFDFFPDRSEMAAWVSEVGGRTHPRLIKDLDFVIVGKNAGPSKLKKIENWDISTMNEDIFLSFFPEKKPKKQ